MVGTEASRLLTFYLMEFVPVASPIGQINPVQSVKREGGQFQAIFIKHEEQDTRGNAGRFYKRQAGTGGRD